MVYARAKSSTTQQCVARIEVDLNIFTRLTLGYPSFAQVSPGHHIECNSSQSLLLFHSFMNRTLYNYLHIKAVFEIRAMSNAAHIL